MSPTIEAMRALAEGGPVLWPLLQAGVWGLRPRRGVSRRRRCAGIAPPPPKRGASDEAGASRPGRVFLRFACHRSGQRMSVHVGVRPRRGYRRIAHLQRKSRYGTARGAGVERSPLPFGRHRWVVGGQSPDIDLSAGPAARATASATGSSSARESRSTRSGDRPFTSACCRWTTGGTAISLVASHCAADGLGLATAIAEAVKGESRDFRSPARATHVAGGVPCQRTRRRPSIARRDPRTDRHSADLAAALAGGEGSVNDPASPPLKAQMMIRASFLR